MMAAQAPVKKLEVKDASELAAFYNVPVSLMNMFFVVFGDTAYPKETFLLYMTHKKGVQRIEVDKPVNVNGEFTTECRIYQPVPIEVLRLIVGLPADERKAMWDFYSKPIREWGRASTANVKMSTMHQWLPEMCIKRAVCRAARLHNGIGTTSYEELPDAVLSEDELKQARNFVKQEPGNGPAQPAAKPENEAARQATIPQPADKGKSQACGCGHDNGAHFNDHGSVICGTCIGKGGNGKCTLPVELLTASRQ